MKNHKISANRKVAYAIKKGELSRPGQCENCRIDCVKLHGHHPDYDKPLDVQWLCPMCHKDEHRKEYLPFGDNPFPPHPFWDDLDISISLMVQQLFEGQVIDKLVEKLKEEGEQKVSSALLCNWANPKSPKQPSSLQFLLLVKITENCTPIDSINEACGKIATPDDDYREGIKHFTTEFEKRDKMRGK